MRQHLTQLASNSSVLSQWRLFAPILICCLSLSLSALGGQLPERGPGTPSASIKPQTVDPSGEEGEAEEAARELKQQEHQRILGLLPNFNTSSVQNAVKLSPQQKIQLATKTALDPFTFLVAAIDGGIGQAQNSFDGYGQGMQGYGKRFGAAYADSFSGTMIGNAFLPILFRQDPRYFRKGSGTFASRVLYAFSTTVRAKRDDGGGWTPNYANVLGNFAAGGLANIYYPASDRGLGLTFQRAATVTAEGCIGAVLVEFWPDIVAHYRRKHQKALNN